MNSAPVAIDLFCGAGGLSLGLVDAGFDVALAADSWAVAIDSYRANFQHKAIVADVGALTATDVRRHIGTTDIDLIVGGPPCQGFSIQRIGQDIDPRNDLVLKFADLIGDLRPKMFLMENVPGLLGKRGRPIFTAFINSLAQIGYYLEHDTLNSADYGVPQTRRRVFVVGTRDDHFPAFTFPTSNTAREQRTVRDAISDLPPPWTGKASGGSDRLHRYIGMSELNRQRLAMIPPGGGFEDLPPDMRVQAHKNGATKIGHRAVYGRLSPDEPASTITARFDSFTRGRFAHPWEDRNITLREGARLQSFPDSHVFLGTQEEVAAQIGNAVSPLLASVLCRAVASHLNQRRGGAEKLRA